jgi:hypothetical protein
MDIGGWLRSLGLEEYETAFRENKVDAAILPKLTAEDLKDLGLAAVGDRRKPLEAIADLQLARSPSQACDVYSISSVIILDSPVTILGFIDRPTSIDLLRHTCILDGHSKL